MTAPLIGISTHRTPHAEGFPLIAVAEPYVRSVWQAGGAPVLIPLGLPEETLLALLGRLDGVLFTGGGDIDPQQYDGTRHPRIYGVDPDRDRVELYLVNQAVQAHKPFLGICRGVQVLNVALGGTLYEHILDQHSQANEHAYYPGWPRNYLAHNVTVIEDSQLRQILGLASIQVNSLHHQGLRQVAPALKAVAFAQDDLVEAVELQDHPFGLAVQWHPEWLQDQAPMRSLFEALVKAARGTPI